MGSTSSSWTCRWVPGSSDAGVSAAVAGSEVPEVGAGEPAVALPSAAAVPSAAALPSPSLGSPPSGVRQLLGQCVGELVGQRAGDVGDDPSAELGGSTGDGEVGDDLHVGRARRGRSARCVILALAVPEPRLSLPLASMIARCVASSFSTKLATPW